MGGLNPNLFQYALYLFKKLHCLRTKFDEFVANKISSTSFVYTTRVFAVQRFKYQCNTLFLVFLFCSLDSVIEVTHGQPSTGKAHQTLFKET